MPAYMHEVRHGERHSCLKTAHEPGNYLPTSFEYQVFWAHAIRAYLNRLSRVRLSPFRHPITLGIGGVWSFEPPPGTLRTGVTQVISAAGYA